MLTGVDKPAGLQWAAADESTASGRGERLAKWRVYERMAPVRRRNETGRRRLAQIDGLIRSEVSVSP